MDSSFASSLCELGELACSDEDYCEEEREEGRDGGEKRRVVSNVDR